jgi:hypothetical protein
MKKYILFTFLLISISVNAQFRDQSDKPVDIKSGIVKDNTTSLFGFINPENFKMHHAFDISFQTFGSGNLALTTYTNSMFYKINEQLNIQADVSLVNSPYNTFGKEFSSYINGLYLSRAQISYRPSENTSIIFEYRNLPNGYYPSYWYGYSPFYRNSFFDNSPFEKEK